MNMRKLWGFITITEIDELPADKIDNTNWLRIISMLLSSVTADLFEEVTVFYCQDDNDVFDTHNKFSAHDD
eukprot:13373730-Ditylum_brightwellii.AAC.1